MNTMRLTMVMVAVFVCTSAAGAASDTDIFGTARFGDIDRVSALLAADASLLEARSVDGETPLHYAVMGSQPEIAALLLECGADVNAVAVNGRTPLHMAATLEDTGLVALLLAAGADPQATDMLGETPLHLAVRRLRSQSVELLLAMGADVNARNARGQTPLAVAGSTRRVEDAATDAMLASIVQRLVAAGAEPVEAQPEGEDALRGGRDGYASFTEFEQMMQDWANNYPSICQLHNLGMSSGSPQRAIWALNITDNPGVEEDEPEFKYVSTMHGDEWTCFEMTLRLVDHMLTNYGSDPNITYLVDEIDIWIVPLMNPWGFAHVTRGNANGADLNRDFPEGAPPNPEPNTTAGREPETAVIMDWTFASSFTCSANLHTGALVVNYPFDNDGSGSRYTPDQDMFVYISEEYSKHNLPMWNGAFTHGITNGLDWYRVLGGMQDWHYRYMGCNEVTIEMSNTKIPPYSQMDAYWDDNRQSMLSYMATCLIGVRGLVTDALTGDPLDATITVVGRDHEIYTDPDVGDYHRMLLPGSYELMFEVDGYEPATLPVTVNAGPATRLDVPFGTPPVTYPNGGEVLDANAPVDVTWQGGIPTTRYQVQETSNYGAGSTTSDDFETGTLGPEYTTGGDADWFVWVDQAHGGTYSARGGDIVKNNQTWMQRDVTGSGNIELSFWYKVSSEAGYDFFSFFVDNDREIHASGEVDWTLFTMTLPPGTYTLSWEYQKDQSMDQGADTAWIDDLSIIDNQTVWNDIIALTDPGVTSVSWTPSTPSMDCKVRVRACYGRSSQGKWDESDDVFTVQFTGPAVCRGDCNCDGEIDFGDINPFVDALLSQIYCDGSGANADVSEDDPIHVGFEDINPFVDLITLNSLPLACP